MNWNRLYRVIFFCSVLRVSTKRTVLLSFCGLILIYLRTFLILQLSVARINDSAFNTIHFPAAVLYSQRINTNWLPCIIYLLVSSPTCSGLTSQAIFRETSIVCSLCFDLTIRDSRVIKIDNVSNYD